ncbi:sterol carrier family protein [Streptomyces sp. I05A-00742]|uniref:sterol carrier family protein n=1 Tax=Streptomyces sp. I05A-00742 TaxID=2732853 RepID=UPI001488A1DA|nr:sterol carrier family protein [Streptomyces sp. I05A-00742]
MTAAPRTPRPRSYDPAKVRAALDGQLRAVREAVTALSARPDAEAALAAATRLDDWTVRDLLAHLAAALKALPDRLAEPSPDPAEPRLDLRRYLASARTAAESAAAADRAPDGEPSDVAGRLDEAATRLSDAVATADPAAPLPTALGPMTVLDYTVTRLLEAVVHADDLTAATGIPVAHDRQALATVTRLLADALAAAAPGGSVEVRVPPFAVVQCVAGPRHTRGTPPNVVETDPLTWIRLATGRLNWADAIENALVGASGERADLSAQLPLSGRSL